MKGWVSIGPSLCSGTVPSLLLPPPRGLTISSPPGRRQNVPSATTWPLLFHPTRCSPFFLTTAKKKYTPWEECLASHF